MDMERLKNKSILVVEDDRVIRENLSSMFRVFFKNVYTAINGEDGIDRYNEYLPDIILTDLKMPHMDGYEMLQNLRANHCDAFTIIVSAHTDTELLIQAIHDNVDRYIIKPVTEDALFEAFTIYLQRVTNADDIKIKIDENLTIDIENAELIIDNKQIHLNKKETLLLKLLTKNTKQTFSYEEIENRVWHNTIMSQSALRSVVRDLRKKIGKNYIKNVSGVGYRFLA
jgi:DNA-binding response OmpR family regulator